MQHESSVLIPLKRSVLPVVVMCLASTPLLAKSEESKPWLGLSFYKNRSQLQVHQVIPSSPSHRAGIKSNDVLVEVENARIKSALDFHKVFATCKVGDKIIVKVERDGELQNKSITLESKPDYVELLDRIYKNAEAKDFNLKVVNGDGSGRLQDFRGKVVLLQFWGSWCPTCRETHKKLDSFEAKWGKRGLEVIGISREEPEVQKKYLRKNSLKFRSLDDSEGISHIGYMVGAFPTMFVIDRKGIIRFISAGGGDYLEETFSFIEKMLN